MCGWEYLPVDLPLFEGQDVAGRTHLVTESLAAHSMSATGAPAGSLVKTVAAAGVMHSDALTLPVKSGEQRHFHGRYLDDPDDSPMVKFVDDSNWPILSEEIEKRHRHEADAFKADVLRTLETARVDVLLVVPSDFQERVREEKPVPVYLLYRDNDDRRGWSAPRCATFSSRWRNSSRKPGFSGMAGP